MLDISDFLKDFIKNHLVDIHNHIEFGCTLQFDTNNIPLEFNQIPGFDRIQENYICYKNINSDIENKDVVTAMNTVQSLLKSQKNPKDTPQEMYQTMMECILDFSKPYSSFVEMLFTNMFVTDNEENKFWRYNQNDPIVKKLGDKQLANKLSSLLGLLYQPNKKSLEGISELSDFELDPQKLNIYEKIWLGLFS